MNLPSSVPCYNSVPLIDLDTLEYLIVKRPPNAKLRAWSKLEETERRWAMFDWATFVIPESNRNVRLLNDLASAYLLSFEATLQILNEELAIPRFEAWLSARVEYDTICRGLRTLRHLEAHIRTGQLAPVPNTWVISRFAHSTTGGTVPWWWGPLDADTLAVLKRPALQAEELSAFNFQSAAMLTLGMMRHGVTALFGIVSAGDA